MNYPKFFQTTVFFAILMIFSSLSCFAQGAKALSPYENKLLNGLKVLVWQDQSAEKVTVKLRIHSGAAFDPKDKMGVMAMLGEILFPNEQEKAFFTEDLDGSLDITTTYDYIQITVTGKSSDILAIIETLSTAVATPQITRENFKLVQAARLKRVEALEKYPAYLADRAVAKRLLGEFPYGRPMEGTSDSVKKIDLADLILARQRFLTADNATLAVVGNVKPDFVYRATRQLFGSWLKSDKKVPATFAMPNEPDLTPQVVEFKPHDELPPAREHRFATRGLARNDTDYWAMRFLADVLQNRIRSELGSTPKSSFSVIHERSLLASYIIFKLSFPPNNEKMADYNVWFKNPISATEFNQARTSVLAEIDQKPIADKFLDVETFRLVSVADEIRKLNSVTLADLQRIADRVAKQPFVSVLPVATTDKE